MRAIWMTAAAAQACAMGVAAAQSPPSPFRVERANEDWSGYRDPARHTRPWRAVKAIPFGATGLLTLGGDVQIRAEVQDAPNFGLQGDIRDDYILVRGLAHASVRLNPLVRFFAELGHHDGIGRDIPFPLDDNRLDVTQAFVEFNAALGGAALTTRLGRQEMILSPRYFASRGGVNTRQRYQGVRAWGDRGPWRAEAFSLEPLRDRVGAFDDDGDDASRQHGLRLRRQYGPHRSRSVAANLYVQERAGLRFQGRQGDEQRISFGGRLQGGAAGWDWDGEGYLQGGDFAGLDVAAWSFSGDLGRRFADAPLKPRVGLRALGGSGDKDPGDGETNTFLGNVVRPMCCGDPLFLLPSNLVAATPTAEIALSSTLTLEVISPAYWRLERADALYAYPQIAYPRTAGAAGDDLVSVAPQATLTWQPSQEATVQAVFLRQQTEGALAASGAKDADFGWIALTLRF
jgi:hypothetical protein